MTVAYTDGACLGNPGPGGWAWAVPDGPFRSGSEAQSTNQRMEIRAALEAVRALSGRLRVVSDSSYVVRCFRERWWERWLANGWRNSNRQPVANRDLWEPLVEAVRARGEQVSFEWVKGHGDDAMNDLVDRLAKEAAATQAGRAGDRPPAPGSLGPPDEPGRPGATAAGTRAGRRGGDREAGPPAPEGHRLVVAGHRPPELGGYGANPVAERVRARLGEILTAKASMHPDLVVLTGLGLGAEQLGAEAAADAGVPYVSVLPYPDPDSVWPWTSRERFGRLRRGAREEVLVDAKVPDTKQRAGVALARRDDWLARQADEAVVVWDGREGTVGRLVRSLQDHLGEEEVWVLDPGLAQ